MPGKKHPPPGCDLTLTSRQIAEACGVSLPMAYRWKKEAGIVMKKGPHGVKRASLGLWGKLRKSDWEQGCSHVGRLMGVSRQAAQQMHGRLVREGHDLPKLAGRPSRKKENG